MAMSQCPKHGHYLPPWCSQPPSASPWAELRQNSNWICDHIRVALLADELCAQVSPLQGSDGILRYKVLCRTRADAERAAIHLHGHSLPPAVSVMSFVFWFVPASARRDQNADDKEIGLFKPPDSPYRKPGEASCSQPRKVAVLQAAALEAKAGLKAGAIARKTTLDPSAPSLNSLTTPTLSVDDRALVSPALHLQQPIHWLTDDPILLARELAAGCALLLQRLDTLTEDRAYSLLSEKYRLELLPAVRLPDAQGFSGSPSYEIDWTNWELRLRFSPVAWFHGIAKPSAYNLRTSNTGSQVNWISAAMDHARRWTQHVRDVENSVPTSMVTRSDTCQPEYFPHSSEKCFEQLSRKDASSRPCEFSINGANSLTSHSEPLHHILVQSITDEVMDGHVHNSTSGPLDRRPVPPYQLAVRSEATRDLILAPELHSTNRMMAVSRDFWWRCVLTCRRLAQEWEYEDPAVESPVCGIALNFGKWETAQGNDPLAKDCHAHAHLFLTPEAYDRNKRLEYKHAPLKGRYHAYEDYLLMDCKELEQDVLLSWDSQQLREKVVRIESKLDSVLEGITKLLHGQATQYTT